MDYQWKQRWPTSDEWGMWLDSDEENFAIDGVEIYPDDNYSAWQGPNRWCEGRVPPRPANDEHSYPKYDIYFCSTCYYICRWEDRPRYNTKHPSLGMSYCPTCKSTPHSQWPVDMTTDEQLMWKQERIDMGFPYRTIWDAQFVYQ